jgi:CRP-like cAMP-binding protein
VRPDLERDAASDAVPLLELDPELASALSDQQRAEAAPALLVRTVVLTPKSWRGGLSAQDLFGLLVIDGALIRRVAADRGRSLEVLTKGDLARPAQEGVRNGSSFSALTETRLAILDQRVANAIAHWPPLFDALLERAMRRVRRLGAQAALDSRVGIERRVLLTLMHLAERCGRRTPEGVVIPLPLSHQMLAELVGAQRPSVSTALSRLASSGALKRTDKRGWIVTAVPGRKDRSPSGPMPTAPAPARARQSTRARRSG